MALGDSRSSRTQRHIAAIFAAQGFDAIIEKPPVADPEDILAEPEGPPISTTIKIIEAEQKQSEDETPVGGKPAGVFEFVAQPDADIKTSYFLIVDGERYKINSVFPERAWGSLQALHCIAERLMDEGLVDNE